MNSLDDVETAVRDELDGLQVLVTTIALAALNDSSTAEEQIAGLSDNEPEIEIIVPPLTQVEVDCSIS